MLGRVLPADKAVLLLLAPRGRQDVRQPGGGVDHILLAPCHRLSSARSSGVSVLFVRVTLERRAEELGGTKNKLKKSSKYAIRELSTKVLV